MGDPRNELYGHPGASIFPRGETGVCHRRRRHTPVKMDSHPSLCASKGKVVILGPTGLDDNPRQEIHYCTFSLASTTYCRRHSPKRCCFCRADIAGLRRSGFERCGRRSTPPHS